nr:tyrosine-type recombinase/integrase [Klebsiella pneumoniae]
MNKTKGCLIANFATVPLPEYHSLRHYAATTFKQNGFPEQFASQVLGHSNATITYNRYGKGIAVRTLVELIEVL